MLVALCIMLETMQYRFKLMPGTAANLQHCPRCQQKRMSPYLDTITGRILEGFGRCNRESSCGFMRIPEREPGQPGQMVEVLPAPKRERVQRVHFSYQWYNDLDRPGLFRDYIRRNFGEQKLARTFERFGLGQYSDQGRDYAVHWHIDEQSNLHTAKLMEYELRTNKAGREVLKRTKRNGSINWLHRKFGQLSCEGQPITFGDGAHDEMWTQTLYGLQQLEYMKSEIVCIVEGYKAAIIASLYFPRYVWIAADSVSTLTAYDRQQLPLMQPLRGRRIYLLPDFDAMGKWNHAAAICKNAGYQIEVHPYMGQFQQIAEKIGPECRDLEDMLLHFDTKHFEHK